MQQCETGTEDYLLTYVLTYLLTLHRLGTMEIGKENRDRPANLILHEK